MPRKSSFEQAFSNLLDHLRNRPNDGARTQRLLRTIRGKIAHDGVVVEAGIELEHTLRDPGLLGRMHRRRIETITVQHDAPAAELLQLARALAEDDGPVPVTDMIHVSMVVDIIPGEMEDRPRPNSPIGDSEIQLVTGFDHQDDREPRLSDGPADELQRLSRAIREGERAGSWTEALHAAQALSHLADRTPSDGRRQMAISGKRVLSPSLMRQFIDHAIRVPEERSRVVHVLEWVGRDAAEVVVDTLTETESIGPKAFLCDLAARMPDAYPMVEVLLRSPKRYQVRLGADLLGRRGLPDAVGSLAAQCDHADPGVRLAIVQALGQVDAPATVEPLLRALVDSEVAVRAAAARGLAGRSTRGVTMALAQALERDRDPTVRIALIEALGAIGTDEATNVLSAVATTGRTLFKPSGYTLDQRLASVAALLDCHARGVTRALERVAAGSRGEVAEAALWALEDRVSGATGNKTAGP